MVDPFAAVETLSTETAPVPGPTFRFTLALGPQQETEALLHMPVAVPRSIPRCDESIVRRRRSAGPRSAPPAAAGTALTFIGPHPGPPGKHW